MGECAERQIEREMEVTLFGSDIFVCCSFLFSFMQGNLNYSKAKKKLHELLLWSFWTLSFLVPNISQNVKMSYF